MKIIGESVTVHKPHYLHLGYLAATVKVTSQTAIGLAFSTFLLGVLLCGYARRKWGPIRNNLQSRQGKFVLAGVSLMVVSVFIPMVMPKHDTGVYSAPYALTRSMLQSAASDIYQFAEAGGAVPQSMDALRSDEQLSAALAEDAWKRPMRYALKADLEHDEPMFSLSSAGADGVFDTEDDIVYTAPADLHAEAPAYFESDRRR